MKMCVSNYDLVKCRQIVKWLQSLPTDKRAELAQLEMYWSTLGRFDQSTQRHTFVSAMGDWCEDQGGERVWWEFFYVLDETGNNNELAWEIEVDETAIA